MHLSLQPHFSVCVECGASQGRALHADLQGVGWGWHLQTIRVFSDVQKLMPLSSPSKPFLLDKLFSLQFAHGNSAWYFFKINALLWVIKEWINIREWIIIFLFEICFIPGGLDVL